MHVFKAAVLVMIFFPLFSWAEKDLCESVQNVNQVVLCAESRSPEVQKAESSLNAKKAAIGYATQYQNPELASEYVAGSSSGKSQSELDLSLAFPVEVGGGRSARKSLAEFELKRAESELAKARGEVRKQVLLNLLRTQQISEEQEMIEESLNAFAKLVRQYQTRPQLSPEQEVTLTVFNVAKTDYAFKKMEYEEEATKIESFFKLTMNKSIKDLKLLMVAKEKKWPEVSDEERDEILGKSPMMAIFEAEIGMTRAEMAKARSEILPAINVGPSLKRVSDGDQTSNQLGVNLSMPLPVLNTNQGGRAVATANLRAAEIRRDFALKEVKVLRGVLARQYKKAVVLLQESPNGKLQESRHKKIEAHFFRGLVPSSLVIEAHRSLVELEKTKNQREMKALENFLDIQILDGKTVEFDL